MAKPISATIIAALAKRLRTAIETGNGCKPLRNDLPAVDLDAAYAVQETNTKHWLKAGRRPVEIGSTAAILCRPARSLADAARFAAETGDTLEAGFVVLASGATAAVALEVDTAVRVEVEGLGATGFSVTA